MQDLPEMLGISRRTLFECRSADSKVTGKTWAKLEKAEAAAENAESSTSPKQADVGETAHSLYAESSVVREEPLTYGAKVDPVSAAFAKIREGLDLLEQLMKNPPK